MDLKDMMYFCTIVEEGQISKAAKRLNISQPPLSLRLKELEEEVGCSLISRSSGKWKVTKEGQLLYRKSQEILSRIDGLAESIRHIGSEFSGEVRIGIGTHCISYFKTIVPLLLERYPRISCRMVVADSPTIERYLQERSIEIAVIRLNLSHDCYTMFNLPPQHMVAVYSNLVEPPSHEGPVTFEELVKYPLLFSRRWANADGFRPIVAAFQSKQLHPQILLDTQAPFLLFELLYTTPAVALIPNTEIPLHAAHVFPVRDIEHYVVFQPVVAYLSDSYLSPQTTAVMELLKERYSG